MSGVVLQATTPARVNASGPSIDGEGPLTLGWATRLEISQRPESLGERLRAWQIEKTQGPLLLAEAGGLFPVAAELSGRAMEFPYLRRSPILRRPDLRL